MKIKKIVYLSLAIIVPLFVTVMVALVSYGAIGKWNNNKEKYVEYLFDNVKSSAEATNLFVKFNSEKYLNNGQYIQMYEDYTTSTNKVTRDTDYVDMGTFKFEYDTLLSTVPHYLTYGSYFYFYDIDNSETNASNPAVIFVEEPSNNSTDNLKLAIQKYQEAIDNETLTDKITFQKLSFISKNMLWTHGDRIPDLGGRGYMNNGTLIEPYIRSLQVSYTFALDEKEEDSKMVNYLDYCNFAIIKLDNMDKPTSMEVLGTGQISNLHPTAEDFLKANPNMSEGYGLADVKALNKAGYFKFIFPTVLWQTVAAAIITGGLGFFFYYSFISDAKKKEKEKLNKK